MSLSRARPRLAAPTQVAGGLTLGLGVSFAAGVLPSAPTGPSLAAAEQVAARFVTGFESYTASSGATAPSGAVAGLARPQLAARMTTPAQGGPPAALAAEHFSVTAEVTGFQVEANTPTLVDVLARTTIHVSTTSGSSTTVRLVPVSLTPTTGRWRVSDVDGLMASAGSPPSDPGAPSAGTVDAGTGSGAGTASGGSSAGSAGPAPAPAAAATTVNAIVVHGPVAGIPSDYVAWAQAAVAAECPGLPWTVLAGVAKVESDFGQSTLPGVSSGANPWGAEGPMQFEPATFAAYASVAPGGADPASPYDPADALYSAAKLLCADGGGSPAGLYAAVFAYNHSDAYVSLVDAYASSYEQAVAGGACRRRAVPGRPRLLRVGPGRGGARRHLRGQRRDDRRAAHGRGGPLRQDQRVRPGLRRRDPPRDPQPQRRSGGAGGEPRVDHLYDGHAGARDGDEDPPDDGASAGR